MKKSFLSLSRLVLACLVLLLFCSCGSSSSDSDSDQSVLKGTAAQGKAITGTITVKDSTGKVKTTSSGADGRYSLDVSDMTAPFVIKAEGASGVVCFSVSESIGTANITPVTGMVLQMAGISIDMTEGVAVTVDF